MSVNREKGDDIGNKNLEPGPTATPFSTFLLGSLKG